MTPLREPCFTPGETEARDLTEHLPEVRVQLRFVSSSQHSELERLFVWTPGTLHVGTFLTETGRMLS